jgi:hypothetical protein
VSETGTLAALLLGGGRRRQVLATGLGIGALAAAILALAWNRETVVDSLASLRSASPWTLLALLGGCAAQLFLSGLVFWWLYRRFVPVPLLEMSALIAAANAANFLPLRPGLVGRIAYLRVRRAVPLAASVRVTVEAAGLSAAVVALVVLFVPLADRAGLPGTAAFLAGGLSVLLATVSPGLRPYAIAALGRLGELGVLTWRYLLAFALIGREIDVDAAMAFACIASASSLVPLVPNGMGVREWAIGLLAPAVAGHSLQEGIAAELVGRAAELAVTVPAGAIAAAWLARRPVAISP